MSDKIPLPFANGFYLSDSLPVSAQECVNYYPNIPQTEALSPRTLFAAPGLSQIGITGTDRTDANRGAWRLVEKPYFVNGTNLYRLNQSIDANGNETFAVEALGAIEGTGRVSMAENGSQLMILVPGGKGYIYTEAGGLVEIVAAGFTANGAPQQVVFIDGYFLCTTDSNKFIISALRDGVNWDALDFGTAEADPDAIVAPIVYRNELFIGGDHTLEAFTNIGGADFPFRRTGLFIDKGVFAPFSIVRATNTFMFMGGAKDERPAIWALSGNDVQKVSHIGIDILLGELTQAEQEMVFAYSYAEKGAYFVAFVLPETTVVYDTTTGLWHERKSNLILPATGKEVLSHNRVTAIVSAYHRLLVGDSEDGRIGVLDQDTYTEYGGRIFRRFATQPFQNNMKSMFLPSIELTVESGTGNSESPDPKMQMEISRNGGKTFTPPRYRSIGKAGQYGRRSIWRRCGRSARFDVYRFTFVEPVKSAILQLTADVRGGDK